MLDDDAFLLAMVHALPDPVVGVDGAGRVRAWNAGACGAFGYSEDEAYGLAFDDVCHDDVVHRKDGSVVGVAREAVPVAAAVAGGLSVVALWVLRPLPVADAPNAGPIVDEALLSSLPPRQREVLTALCTGHSEKEIAASIGLSQHTVHGHIKALYRRCGVQSRAALVARAVARKR